MADAVRDRKERESWNNVHELLALLVEMVSVMRIEALLAAGAKRWAVPEVVRIPRPGDETKQEAMVVTPSQFARMTVSG